MHITGHIVLATTKYLLVSHKPSRETKLNITSGHPFYWFSSLLVSGWMGLIVKQFYGNVRVRKPNNHLFMLFFTVFGK